MAMRCGPCDEGHESHEDHEGDEVSSWDARIRGVGAGAAAFGPAKHNEACDEGHAMKATGVGAGAAAF